jgi:RNA polymerase sigma-70 factor (ECF subfamily)
MAVKIDRHPSVDTQSRDETFTELYEGAFPTLVGYCRGLLGPGGDAEAVAQEAFLRAWVAWDRYETTRPFWALVATIARNLCMDHHRHERVVVTVLETRGAELSGLDAAGPDEHVERHEEYRWAREALAELRPNHQRLLTLREIEGLSCESIAEVEGTTPESVAATLYRARQRLRDAYNRVATGALAGLALFPVRHLRRRAGILTHVGSQVAVASPAVTARAGEVLATVVALAVVTVGGQAPASTPHRDGSASVASASGQDHGKAGAEKGTSTRLADGANKDGATAAVAGGKAGNATAIAAAGAAPGTPGAVAAQLTTFNQVVAASGSDRGSELYGVGTTLGCTANCAVLLHSTDGGASWSRLPAVGFAGGTVLLPPSYPADKRIFVAGPAGLQVSTDGGAHLTAVGPVAGAATMSPGFSDKDPRILLGAVPGWEYHDDTKAVMPLTLGPLPPSHAGFTFAFAPQGIDPLVLVGAATAEDGDHLQSSQVVVCHQAACDKPVPLRGGDGVPTLLVSRSVSKNGLVFAWVGDRLFRSTDGATTFDPVTLPVRAAVAGLAEGGDGTVYLAQPNGPEGRSHTTGGLFASKDQGRTWRRIGDTTALAKGTTMVARLPGDVLVASPAAGGLLCSADAGRTWQPYCPAPPPVRTDHGHGQADAIKAHAD